MAKCIRYLLLALACFLGGPLRAADLGSADEAVSMVRKAVAMLADSGKDKTIAEANNPHGRFVDRDLYVVIHDLHGTVLANPVLPRMVGHDLSAVKDVDGKMFIKERLDMLKTSNRGWIDFKWPNSVTKQIEKRSVYFERAGDLVVACGILKQ
ncbi:Cache domain-containing protein [Duganella sp. CF402]|uniref:cache domain-containing protein n=1 Tax=unclassified Duganella TaxID=2636909 RepID=UPI0008CEC698|nr:MULTISPECIES: cache domain-containing protein [unclassified Duganella]RZT08846.1 single cache domain-containing protein [Duganella sp. BK701]SEL79684.1 Cache domain-containing protein [Duganella sp. CF402]